MFMINVNVWFCSVTDGGNISSLNFYSGICGICFGTNMTLPDRVFGDSSAEVGFKTQLRAKFRREQHFIFMYLLNHSLLLKLVDCTRET